MSTAAVGVVAFGAAAQNSSPASKAGEGPVSGSLNQQVAATEERYAFPQDLTGVVNRGSPPVGGGCQASANNNGLNYTAFSIADNFNPSASGQLTAISWSAVYRAGTAAPFTNGTPPATETFTVRILNDNAGVPGTEVFNTTVTNPTRTNSGGLLGVLTIWDYTATGLVGPNLTAGTCYWLEITNTSTLVAPTNVSFWMTASPVPGDSVGYQVGRANCGYSSFDQTTTDQTFCVNLALNNLDLVNCPLVTPPAPSCTNPTVNGNGIVPSNTGIYSITPVDSVYTGTQRFQFAENFQLSAGGNLSSVCFWGFFVQQIAGGRPEACNKQFDITIWNRDPATGGPGTQLATRRVNGTTITAARGLDAAGNDIYSVDFAGSPIALLANTCYYLTVSHALVTTDPNRQAAFLWGTVADITGDPIRDGSMYGRPVSLAGVAGAWVRYNNAIGLNANNMSYLLNLGPVTATSCNVAPPANDACAAAVSLPLTGAPVAGSNVNAMPDLLPGTAFDLVDGAAVWFTFIGTGNDVTVTTCNAGTALDTVVHVFCAPNGCAGPFNRVFGNDDANPACGVLATASTVTVPTVNGTQYYVVVNGFQGVQNVFNISASQGAVSNPVATCDPNCNLNAAPFDVAEAEACQAGADSNGACATAVIYPNLGDTAKGSVSTTAGTGGTRDIDLWRMPAGSNGQTVVVAIQSENPLLVQFLNDASGNCSTAFTVVPNTSLGIAACIDLGVEIFEVTLPATGTNYFLLTTPSFAGSTCAQGFDEYRFEVRVPSVGACCLASTACFVTTFADCDAQSAGDPNDFWAEGVTCAVSPCDSQPGRCCFQDGTCQLVPSAGVGNAAACTAASGTYTAGGVCTPNTCPTATNIACCRGTTCTLEPAANCTGPNTFATTATACNVAPNAVTPCCKANFNQVGGVTVQDIFDFLAAYFSSNPLADFNGVGGVTVQDIFDFLAAYFQGCP